MEEKILNKGFKIKRGFYSVFFMFFFVAVLVLANLIIQNYDFKYDLTKEKFYSLSEQSLKIINDLKEKINIYVLSAPEENNFMVNKLLEKYKSKNINLEYKSQEKVSVFKKRFESSGEIPDGSIIVEAKNKFKIIKPEDFFEYDIDYTTFQQKLKGINIEPEITNAIYYVTNDFSPKIYKLIGHGEEDLNDIYKKQIEFAGYELKDLDLLNEKKVPDDCEILFITTPEKDWTEQEKNLIDDYLSEHSVIIFMDLTNKSFENVNALTKKYGFEFRNNLVIENSGENFLRDYKTYLIPNYTQNEICNNLQDKKYKLLIPFCQHVFINHDENIKVLLESSRDSYAKADPNSKNPEKEKNDLSGPLNLAICYSKDKTKIIAVGSKYILDPEINNFVRGSNLDFLISALNNLCANKNKSLYVPPKNYDKKYISFTHNQAIIISVTSIIIIPLIIFVVGLIIIKKRQNQS